MADGADGSNAEGKLESIDSVALEQWGVLGEILGDESLKTYVKDEKVG